MTMTDPISDMLTRIRNAQKAKHEELTLPYSKMKKELLSILIKEGYIAGIEEKEENKKKSFVIKLKYDKYGDPVIHRLTRLSKPGLRRYIPSTDIRPVMGGMGIAILSTNKGVMTNKEARKQNVGGELICEIW